MPANPHPLPTDRAFWADDGYGEIVFIRFAETDAPWPHFAQVEDDGEHQAPDVPLFDGREIPDWDDDRAALAARLEASFIAASEA